MKRHTGILAAALSMAAVLSAALAANQPRAAASDGEVKFNNHCRTCHSVKKDDNRMGPSLHDIFVEIARPTPEEDSLPTE